MSLKKQTRTIPKHLAIILDGNGRWALKNNLSRSLGHKQGAKVVKEIIDYSFSLGITVLSLFCFSTENWKRSEEEVNFLMELPIKYFDQYEERLIKNDIKVIISGDISKLPLKTKLSFERIILNTKKCQSKILNICFNYGSIDELVRATKLICIKAINKEIEIDQIDQNLINNHLYSKGLPDVDLLIRTSNEKRLSNFMLIQSSYAELYFTKTLWPLFTKKDLDKAIEEYSKRKRRFGGV